MNLLLILAYLRQRLTHRWYCANGYCLSITGIVRAVLIKIDALHILFR